MLNQDITQPDKSLYPPPKNYDSRSISKRESANDLKFRYNISRTFIFSRVYYGRNLTYPEGAHTHRWAYKARHT